MAEHKATDEADDRQLGGARGDELPEQLRTAEGRREFFAQAKQRRRRDRPGGQESPEEESPEQPERRPEPQFEFDEERIVARTQGREGWLREARRQLEQHRWEHPDQVPRSRSERLLLASERLEEELRPSAAGIRRMSSSGSAAARPVGTGSAARRSRISHPSFRLGR